MRRQRFFDSSPADVRREKRELHRDLKSMGIGCGHRGNPQVPDGCQQIGKVYRFDRAVELAAFAAVSADDFLP